MAHTTTVEGIPGHEFYAERLFSSVAVPIPSRCAQVSWGHFLFRLPPILGGALWNCMPSLPPASRREKCFALAPLSSVIYSEYFVSWKGRMANGQGCVRA